MNDADRVRCAQAVRELRENVEDLGIRYAADARRARRKRLPDEQLHCEPRRTGCTIDSRRNDLHDVIALDARGNACLLIEASPQLLIVHEFGEHQLQGAAAPRRDLLDYIDRAHSALT